MSKEFTEFCGEAAYPPPPEEPPTEPPTPPKPPKVSGWYVAHDREYGPIWRENVPEVFHFDQDRPTILTEEWQWFVFRFNDGHTDKELKKHPELVGTGMTENNFSR